MRLAAAVVVSLAIEASGDRSATPESPPDPPLPRLGAVDPLLLEYGAIRSAAARLVVVIAVTLSVGVGSAQMLLLATIVGCGGGRRGGEGREEREEGVRRGEDKGVECREIFLREEE